MKRFGLASLSLLLLAGGFSAAYGSYMTPPDDVAPTLWTRGEEGTTCQKWYFDDVPASKTPDPETEDFFNPNGDPSLLVRPTGSWQGSWGERIGVWPLSGMIIADIPNYEENNNYKFIQIQLIWAGEVGHATAQPCVWVIPSGDSPNGYEFLDLGVNLTQKETVILGETGVSGAGTYWYRTTYNYKITPNPDQEQIRIGGSIMVDKFIVDTICTDDDVPEPTTLGLLVAGGGVGILFRKRRE